MTDMTVMTDKSDILSHVMRARHAGASCGRVMWARHVGTISNLSVISVIGKQNNMKEAGMIEGRCGPHRWNYEAWLPILQGSKPAEYDAIECLNCGRILAVVDTSPNMRASIAHAIASRVYGGDEYDEVRDSVMDYFNQWLSQWIGASNR